MLNQVRLKIIKFQIIEISGVKSNHLLLLKKYLVSGRMIIPYQS